MRRRFKVRFHLGRGKNYKKWKIEDTHDGSVIFTDTSTSITMKDVLLVNSKTGAIKIHEKRTSKMVVAWIECEDLHFTLGHLDTEELTEVMYNPHVRPNWVINDTDCDGAIIKCLTTKFNKVFIYKN